MKFDVLFLCLILLCDNAVVADKYSSLIDDIVEEAESAVRDASLDFLKHRIQYDYNPLVGDVDETEGTPGESKDNVYEQDNTNADAFTETILSIDGNVKSTLESNTKISTESPQNTFTNTSKQVPTAEDNLTGAQAATTNSSVVKQSTELNELKTTGKSPGNTDKYVPFDTISATDGIRNNSMPTGSNNNTVTNATTNELEIITKPYYTETNSTTKYIASTKSTPNYSNSMNETNKTVTVTNDGLEDVMKADFSGGTSFANTVSDTNGLELITSLYFTTDSNTATESLFTLPETTTYINTMKHTNNSVTNLTTADLEVTAKSYFDDHLSLTTNNLVPETTPYENSGNGANPTEIDLTAVDLEDNKRSYFSTDSTPASGSIFTLPETDTYIANSATDLLPSADLEFTTNSYSDDDSSLTTNIIMPETTPYENSRMNGANPTETDLTVVDFEDNKSLYFTTDSTPASGSIFTLPETDTYFANSITDLLPSADLELTTNSYSDDGSSLTTNIIMPETTSYGNSKNGENHATDLTAYDLEDRTISYFANNSSVTTKNILALFEMNLNKNSGKDTKSENGIDLTTYSYSTTDSNPTSGSIFTFPETTTYANTNNSVTDLTTADLELTTNSYSDDDSKFTTSNILALLETTPNENSGNDTKTANGIELTTYSYSTTDSNPTSGSIFTLPETTIYMDSSTSALTIGGLEVATNSYVTTTSNSATDNIFTIPETTTYLNTTNISTNSVTDLLSTAGLEVTTNSDSANDSNLTPNNKMEFLETISNQNSGNYTNPIDTDLAADGLVLTTYSYSNTDFNPASGSIFTLPETATYIPNSVTDLLPSADLEVTANSDSADDFSLTTNNILLTLYETTPFERSGNNINSRDTQLTTAGLELTTNLDSSTASNSPNDYIIFTIPEKTTYMSITNTSTNLVTDLATDNAEVTTKSYSANDLSLTTNNIINTAETYTFNNKTNGRSDSVRGNTTSTTTTNDYTSIPKSTVLLNSTADSVTPYNIFTRNPTTEKSKTNKIFKNLNNIAEPKTIFEEDVPTGDSTTRAPLTSVVESTIDLTPVMIPPLLIPLELPLHTTIIPVIPLTTTQNQQVTSSELKTTSSYDLLHSITDSAESSTSLTSTEILRDASKSPIMSFKNILKYIQSRRTDKTEATTAPDNTENLSPARNRSLLPNELSKYTTTIQITSSPTTANQPISPSSSITTLSNNLTDSNTDSIVSSTTSTPTEIEKDAKAPRMSFENILKHIRSLHLNKTLPATDPSPSEDLSPVINTSLLPNELSKYTTTIQITSSPTTANQPISPSSSKTTLSNNLTDSNTDSIVSSTTSTPTEIEKDAKAPRMSFENILKHIRSLHPNKTLPATDPSPTEDLSPVINTSLLPNELSKYTTTKQITSSQTTANQPISPSSSKTTLSNNLTDSNTDSIVSSTTSTPTDPSKDASKIPIISIKNILKYLRSRHIDKTKPTTVPESKKHLSPTMDKTLLPNSISTTTTRSIITSLTTSNQPKPHTPSAKTILSNDLPDSIVSSKTLTSMVILKDASNAPKVSFKNILKYLQSRHIDGTKPTTAPDSKEDLSPTTDTSLLPNEQFTPSAHKTTLSIDLIDSRTDFTESSTPSILAGILTDASKAPTLSFKNLIKYMRSQHTDKTQSSSIPDQDVSPKRSASPLPNKLPKYPTPTPILSSSTRPTQFVSKPKLPDYRTDPTAASTLPTLTTQSSTTTSTPPTKKTKVNLSKFINFLKPKLLNAI